MAQSSAKSGKFTFDTEFRDGRDVVSQTAHARQKKILTNEEIETMCARAKQEGGETRQVQATENVERTIAALVISIRAALDQSHAEIEMVRAEAAELAFAAARKIAPAAIAALPAADVEAALREAMHRAISEPRLSLRASPAVIEAIESRITAITQEEGYDGRVILAGDASFAGADCRIEWRSGGCERSESVIEAALGALMERRFSHFPDSNA